MKAVIHSILIVVTIFSLGLLLRGAGLRPATEKQAPVMTDFMAPIFQSGGVVGVIASGGKNQAIQHNRNLCEEDELEEDLPQQEREKVGCVNVCTSAGVVG
jgi:hypothetical protein